MVTVKVKKLPHYDNSFPLPNYQTNGAAGADVRAMLPEKALTIKPGERLLIPTGMIVEIPEHYEIQVRPRSGLSLKTSLMILNAPGTIDSDYRGEVKIIMGNLGKENQTVNHGDRIAQLILAPVVRAQFVEVNDLQETARGSGGFGHTGVGDRCGTQTGL